MKMHWTAFTATAMVMAIVPASLSARTSDGSQRRLDRQITRANGALARGNPAAAIRLAEAAVLQAPRDAQARAMLGRAYLAAGRFQSAETAFGDALTLDPSSARVAVNRAIAQIALGRFSAAAVTLDAVRADADSSDVGLALALLGRMDEARTLLLAAARAPGADARTRQNLAFAYALDGRWNDAATVAAQDIPAEMVPERLRRWAMVGQLRASPAMQVGAMLGTLPAADAGQPAALALVADPKAPVLLADLAAPASLPAMVVPPTMMPAPPIDAPLSLQPGAPTLPSTMAAAVSRPQTVARPNVRQVQAFAGPPVMRTARGAGAKRQRVAGEESATPGLIKIATPLRDGGRGPRWAVQLGAYVDPARPQIAWARLNAKASFLDAYSPTGSGFRKAGTFYHRLSVGGFTTRGEAVRLCARIRRAGAQCFVRFEAGDRPLQWAIGPRAGQSA